MSLKIQRRSQRPWLIAMTLNRRSLSQWNSSQQRLGSRANLLAPSPHHPSVKSPYCRPFTDTHSRKSHWLHRMIILRLDHLATPQLRYMAMKISSIGLQDKRSNRFLSDIYIEFCEKSIIGFQFKISIAWIQPVDLTSIDGSQIYVVARIILNTSTSDVVHACSC
jgi:hypothetical protein